MNDAYLLAGLYLLFFAFLSAFLASLKQRNVKQWFWIGALLGIAAVVVLLFSSNKIEETDETHTP